MPTITKDTIRQKAHVTAGDTSQDFRLASQASIAAGLERKKWTGLFAPLILGADALQAAVTGMPVTDAVSKSIEAAVMKAS